ncbi:MAG: lysylphosphatidylglycerol synthase transmembrane domain-containing protein [Bacteroidales bacterium]|nr:lysylphosphatidylglycerol synthase transmembrane domain-containing protein [Bacteroidales bacterium]
MGKTTRSLILKVIGSALILWLLFRFIDFDLASFLEVFREMNLPLYFFSLSGVIIVLAIKSYRWHLIIRSEGQHYPVFKSFGAYMASYTIGIVTPGRIGEIARLYYLRQDCAIGFLPAFRTIVSDRVFDLGVLVMMAFAGILHFGPLAVANPYFAAMAGILIFFAGLISGVLLIRKMLAIKRFEHLSALVFVYDSLRIAIGRKSIKLWLITFVAYLAFYASVGLIFKALDIELALVDIAIVLSVVGLASILPISWAGFGTREMTLVYLLGFYGIAAETALSFSLLQFLAFFLWGSLIGLIFWFLMPVSLENLKEDTKVLKEVFSRRKDKK